MALRTYDPKKVIVIVGVVPIGGFADGSFITVSRANDTFSKVSGADGVVSRAKSNDKSGEISITLSQTSPSNDVLSLIAQADELTNNGVVPIWIRDSSGRTNLLSAFAWVRKPPDVEFGKEITDREWMFDAVDIDFFVGGNFQAE